MKKKEEINQVNGYGSPIRLWKNYHINGKIYWEGSFTKNPWSQKIDLWTWYYQNGLIEKETIFII